jgi:hypothetical protein
MAGTVVWSMAGAVVWSMAGASAEQGTAMTTTSRLPIVVAEASPIPPR